MKRINKQYADINKRFKEIRKKHNLTQKEMGDIIKLSSPAVSAIEQGLYTPNFGVLRIMKKKFKVDYDFIIDGQTEEEKENLRQENLQLKSEIDRLTKVLDKLLSKS